MNVQDLINIFKKDFENKKNNFPKQFGESTAPIVWVGDEPAYKISKRKILTIAVNPSFKEFEDNHFLVTEGSATEDVNMALNNTMNNYFKESSNPNRNWFDKGPEKELHFLNASYYEKNAPAINVQSPTYKYRAIHTEFQSSIATNKIWSDLTDNERGFLSNHDNFYSLFKFMNPDIAIFYSNLQSFQEFIHLVNDNITLTPTYFSNQNEEPLPLRNINSSNVNSIRFGIIKKDDSKNSTGANIIWVKNSQGSAGKYGQIAAKFLNL